MALSRECGPQRVHSGDIQISRGFWGQKSLHPAAAGFSTACEAASGDVTVTGNHKRGDAMTELVLQFLLLAAAVAAAGTCLALSADRIAEITKLGRLLVGSLLLAGATSLPELSVDISAIRKGLTDLAIGDLLGSSLMNLLILAVLDLAVRSRGGMLSRQAASHALSGTLAIGLTAIVGLAILTAEKLPPVTFLNVGGWSLAVVIAYALGARMIFINQRIAARSAAEARAQEHAQPEAAASGWAGLWKPAGVFLLATAVLIVAGPRLAETAGELADHSGLGRTFVGTTLVAIATSLPELVASITAIRVGAFDLVVGNVFGSNAFNMVLFAPLDAIHDGPLFVSVNPAHAASAFAVILATVIAVLGQLYSLEHRKRVVEPDALLMLLVLGGAFLLVFRLS
jgi:cation:H+ antiporter